MSAFDFWPRLENLLNLVESSKDENLHEDVAWMIANIPDSEVCIPKAALVAARPQLAEHMSTMSPLKRKKQAIVVLKDFSKRSDLKGQVADVLLQIIESYNAPLTPQPAVEA